MEVNVTHVESGCSCVACVTDDDTVLDLKRNALKTLFSGSLDTDREAARLLVLVGRGGEGSALEDGQRISDTPLEGGGDVELVRHCVRAPANHFITTIPLQSLALSPCSTQCVVGTCGGCAVLFDTTTAAAASATLVCGDNRSRVTSASFSRCGRWLATGSSDKSISVWVVASHSLAHTFKEHGACVLTLSWTHDGFLVSGSGDGSFRVWDVSSGSRCIRAKQAHSEFVQAISVSHSSIFTASLDKTICVWDVNSFDRKATLTEHTDFVLDLAISSDELLLVSCSADSTVKVWCTVGLLCLRTVHTTSMPSKVAVAQTRGLLVVSFRDRVDLHCLSTGAVRKGLCKQGGGRIALSLCERWLFVGCDVTVRVHDMASLEGT